MKTYPLLLAALLGLSQCKKKDVAPVDQLPPATQTGANTIGCLVNGQVWTPQGNDGSNNYIVVYDQALGASLDLRTYRYQQKPTNNYQYLNIFAGNVRIAGGYDLRDLVHTRVSWYDRLTGCDLRSGDADTLRWSS